LAYSTDGITWTRVPNLSAYSSKPIWSKAIAYGGGKFVSGGGSGYTAYSTDGVTWTFITDNVLNNYTTSLNAIAYGGGKFVAGGKFSLISYSNKQE